MQDNFVDSARSLHDFLASCFLMFFSLYLFSCVFLMSGKLLGFPVRIVLSALVMFLCLLNVLFSMRANVNWLLVVIGVFGAMLFWVLLGFVNGYPEYSVWGQFLDVFSTLFPLVFGWYAHSVLGYKIETAIRVIVYACLLHALVKIIYFLLMYLGVWDYASFVEWCMSVYGLVPITLISGDFVRINNVNDFFFPLVLACSFLPILGRVRVFLFLVVVAALIISYSRYLWFYSFVVCFLAFFLFYKGRRFLYWAMASCLVVIFFLFFVEYDYFFKFISERYFGEKAGLSDSIREDMLPFLINMIGSSPILGNGFGSYAYAYFRFDENPWLYELQWLSWIKDVGLAGLVATIFALCKYYGLVSLAFLRINKFSVIWLGCFSLWLSSGMVNCFLLGAAAGVVFYLLWLMRFTSFEGGI